MWGLACSGPDCMSGELLPGQCPQSTDGCVWEARTRFSTKFQGFLRVADSLLNHPNRKSRKCLASLVFRRAKGIRPGCSHQARLPASPRDEPACRGIGRSLAAVFWAYPEADVEANFSFANRTPKRCAETEGQGYGRLVRSWPQGPFPWISSTQEVEKQDAQHPQACWPETWFWPMN